MVKSFLNFLKSRQNSLCATRELNEYAKQLFKDRHFTVIDPALVKSKNDWISCISDMPHEKDYVFGYAPYNTEEQKIAFENYEKKLRIDINILKNNNGVSSYDGFTYAK